MLFDLSYTRILAITEIVVGISRICISIQLKYFEEDGNQNVITFGFIILWSNKKNNCKLVKTINDLYSLSALRAHCLQGILLLDVIPGLPTIGDACDY